MNAIEIEQAISELIEKEFSPENFAYEFLEAFGDKATTIKRLRAGSTNASDLKNQGGVLKRNNIHILVCDKPDNKEHDNNKVTHTLNELRQSPATQKAKAKFILATDGNTLEAEELDSGDTLACEFKDFTNHFGFFLSLAGISTVKQIRDNPVDIKATSRLNKLYVELLKDNEDWATEERRHDMNHFMARLIFCFFAEDTGIFNGDDLFTATVEQMSGSKDGNTHIVIGEIFRAMDIPSKERTSAELRPWADQFPYVNGGLFSSELENNQTVPVFSRIARSYLLHAGRLDWKAINPDIFGSMIQAVTDEDERGSLGMHYTSVPNILKVLNPLFLDDLRNKLKNAADNPRKLLNLKKRLAKIRVFDPACGSGNFLVIAYKQLREIEFEINQGRNEAHLKSVIPLTNFRGIEIKSFSAEIARLALIIAEYQCDVLYRGQQDALAEFLPLDAQNWITCGNALRLDWLNICPPTGKTAQVIGDDLFSQTENEAEIDFENEGGETFICGNPPYLGSQWQSKEQKDDLKAIFDKRVKSWKSLDYVAGWFMKAADYGTQTQSSAAFVSTNSICQGRQVETLWKLIIETGHSIAFAHTSFKWANLATYNAGVTVVIVGISIKPNVPRHLYTQNFDGETMVKYADNINPYLISGANIIVSSQAKPINQLNEMSFGNMPNEGGYLLLNQSEANIAVEKYGVPNKFIRPFVGSQEFIKGLQRQCIWIKERDYAEALKNKWLNKRFKAVREQRASSKRANTQELANTPYRFGEIRQHDDERIIIIPRVTSENRSYLPVGIANRGVILGDRNFALYDAPLWNMALIASRLHWVWIGTVCVRMRTDFSYSNTLGWNTFPVPKLTEKNKADLTRCAEDILLAREAHFPATIADLYKPDEMPDNLRRAHKRNDEVLERIYIGRTFKNDTERLEKLFELYSKMTSSTTATEQGQTA